MSAIECQCKAVSVHLKTRKYNAVNINAIECYCKAVSVHLKTRKYNAVNISAIGCQCKAVSGVVLSCLGINWQLGFQHYKQLVNLVISNN